MKTLRIICIILLIGLGLVALLADLLQSDSTFGFVISFVSVKFMGLLLLYLAYQLYKKESFIDYLDEDDDMDRLA